MFDLVGREFSKIELNLKQFIFLKISTRMCSKLKSKSEKLIPVMEEGKEIDCTLD